MKLNDAIKFDEKGLVCAVIQDADTGQVLMVGYMNVEALTRTLRDKKAWFWSRSRQELWLKGETSGNFLHIDEMAIDCDGDALLLKCKPDGPKCHTLETSCFYRGVEPDGTLTFPDGVDPQPTDN